MKTADELMSHALQCDVRAAIALERALRPRSYLSAKDQFEYAQVAAAFFTCADALRARAERAGRAEAA